MDGLILPTWAQRLSGSRMGRWASKL